MGESYDDFIMTVSEVPDDLDKYQSTFDDLLTSHPAKNSDGYSIMSNFTEETKQATAELLTQMGVANECYGDCGIPVLVYTNVCKSTDGNKSRVYICVHESEKNWLLA